MAGTPDPQIDLITKANEDQYQNKPPTANIRCRTSDQTNQATAKHDRLYKQEDQAELKQL